VAAEPPQPPRPWRPELPREAAPAVAWLLVALILLAGAGALAAAALLS
jgi:hypothetical protein